MDRRHFLSLSSLSLLSGCAFTRIDPWHVLIRSDRFDTVEQANAVAARGRLDWTDDGRIRVLYVEGTPYERGYQQGVLLRNEIQDNLGYIYEKALSKFHFDELFDESYERMRSFIPQDYVDEMHGLAHGSRMPLKIVHAIHALPEIGEWGGKRKIKEVVKKMMDGELGTSCSNWASGATSDGGFYAVRILDWGLHRISKLHEYPLICISKPEKGFISANITWCGFLGAVSGMNERGITLGEMGYGDPAGETMRGVPMPFLLREVMTYANSLKDVRRIIQAAPGTNSFIYLMTDGKKREAEMYIRDKDRFIVAKPGEEVKDRNKHVLPIRDIVYGGHYLDKMNQQLTSTKGQVNPEKLMKEIIPELVMPSNFQNVVYDPVNLRFWVSNALNKKTRAAEAPYTFFDLKRALGRG